MRSGTPIALQFLRILKRFYFELIRLFLSNTWTDCQIKAPKKELRMKLSTLNAIILAFLLPLAAEAGIFDKLRSLVGMEPENSRPGFETKVVDLNGTPIHIGSLNLVYASADALWAPFYGPKRAPGNMSYAFQENQTNYDKNLETLENTVRSQHDINVAETYIVESPVRRFKTMGYSYLPQGRPDNAFEMVRNSIYQFCKKAAAQNLKTLMISADEFLIFSYLGSKWGARAITSGIYMATLEGATFEKISIGGYGYSNLSAEIAGIAETKDYVDYVRGGTKDVVRGQTRYYIFEQEGYLGHSEISWRYGNAKLSIDTSTAIGFDPKKDGNIELELNKDKSASGHSVEVQAFTETVKDRNTERPRQHNYSILKVKISENFLETYLGTDIETKKTALRAIFVEAANKLADPKIKDTYHRIFLPSYWIEALDLEKYPELFSEIILSLEPELSRLNRHLHVDLEEKIGKEVAMDLMRAASWAIEDRLLANGDFYSADGSKPKNNSQLICPGMF